MKKNILLFSFLFVLLFSFFPQEILKDFIITSQFADTRGDHFHTGIDLSGSELPVFAGEDVEVLFMNKKRSKNIQYGNGNFLLLQNVHGDLRYNYSHLDDDSYNEQITYYKKNDFIGLTGNTGHTKEKHLHLEIEDIKNRKILNPIAYIPIEDKRKPIIQDLFFIDIHNQKLSLFQKKKIIRGGKLFIKCVDYMDNNPNPLVPYQIEVFINGNEFYTLNFSSLDKKNGNFYLTDSEKEFYGLYQTGESGVFFLREQYFLPGLMGIKVVVKDYAGNEATFVTSFRVLAK